ncbi:hypothetical protein FA13DRAFT_1795174 [Coprinellus micaceus]|uniref:Uncharacterized protein n=1 Tax=Coprinellus micaceus TaxID=71717 RepID=A0A4Y7SYI5_COPMI|nr:hypothetical protein FA13DRAFT_1795174 [Coprinellus micaceus]
MPRAITALVVNAPDMVHEGSTLQASHWEIQKKELEDNIVALQESVDRKNKEASILWKELEGECGLRERVRNLEQDLRQARILSEKRQRDYQELQQRCIDATTRLEATQGLLKRRTEELTTVQAFTTTADQFSISDVTRMVEQLNEDIYQVAAQLSDTILMNRQAKQGPDIPGLANARKSVAEIYGDTLVEKLTLHIAQDDPLLFECLVQNVLALRCYRLIRSINPTSSTINNTLNNVWEKLVVSHGPTIAKKWLAMTSSQMDFGRVEVADVSETLFSMMEVCGWQATDCPGSKTPALLFERISEIDVAALEIRKMMVEGILSTEMEPTMYKPNQRYSPAHMQDAHDFGRSPSGECFSDIALLTTGLGVQLVTRNNSPPDIAKPKLRDTIMKAKVLLSSTLTTQGQTIGYN